MKTLLPLFFLEGFLLINSVPIYSQISDDDTMEQQSITIGYVTEKTRYYVPVEKYGNKRLIYFYGGINDSVCVYLNNKLVFSKWVKTPERSATNFACLINMEMDIKAFNYVRVVLVNAKEFIEMPIDSRFFSIYLYYLNRHDNVYYWRGNYSNLFPSE